MLAHMKKHLIKSNSFNKSDIKLKIDSKSYTFATLGDLLNFVEKLSKSNNSSISMEIGRAHV